MIRATMVDGAQFEGATPEEVVRAMKADEWGAPEALTEYMVETAKRVFKTTGVTVRTNAADAFLTDLLQAGFVTTLDGSN